ncbi:hypothetical protein HanRHA438_Chr09g0374001 [Helianthus annuus]|nr:hypothetical protein HanRHA438_Chr09g0374001 [Helianthus annuus]
MILGIRYLGSSLSSLSASRHFTTLLAFFVLLFTHVSIIRKKSKYKLKPVK